MQSRQPFFSALITLSLLSSFVYADSQSKNLGFTLQVAAFPETAESEAESFITKIAEAGEQPIWGTIDIPGRGNWIRGFIGTFKTQLEARQYAEPLIARRVSRDFIIKKSSETNPWSRPRSVIRKDASQRQANPSDVAERLFDVAVDGKRAARRESWQTEAQGQAQLPVHTFRVPPNEVAARPPTAQANNPPLLNQDPILTPNQQTAQTPNQQKPRSRNIPEEPNSSKGLSRAVPPALKAQDAAAISGKGIPASNISLFNNIASGRFAFAITSRDSKRTLLNLAPAIDLQTMPRADAVKAIFD